MKKVSTTSIASPPTGMGAVGKAWEDAVSVSFDRFCLTAGIEALARARCPDHQGPVVSSRMSLPLATR
jgi:hypothetical protein